MPLYLLILVGAAVTLAILSLPLTSRPIVGAVLVIGGFLTQAILVDVPSIHFGLLIHPEDIIFALLFAAAALRYAMGKSRVRGMGWLPIFLFVLFSIGVVRGIASFGIKDAGNEAREWFYFLSGVIYFSSFNLGAVTRRRLITAWMVACLALVSIAAFRWAASASGMVLRSEWAIMAGDKARPLTAGQANFLAIAFFASLFLNISQRGPMWQRKIFLLLGPVLLLLQHRTVWAGVILGMLWLGLGDARFRKKALRAIFGMAVLGTLLLTFLAGHHADIAGDALRDSATNNDTLLWRVEGWHQLLFNNPAANKLNDTIGQPFGTGYARIIMGHYIPGHIYPHNYYVEAFLRVGAVGLFLLIWMYVKGIRRLRDLPLTFHAAAYPDVRFWSLVLILQLAFFFTYGAPYDQSILTGVALAGMLPKSRRAKLALPPPQPAET